MDEMTRPPTRRNVYEGFCWRGSQRHYRRHQWSAIQERHDDSTFEQSSDHVGSFNQASGSDQRVADVDRDAVIRDLNQHFQAGRLDLAEFDERTEQALRSRTRRDLNEVLTDLPSLANASIERRDRLRIRPWIFIAIAFVVVFAVTVSNFAFGSHHSYWFPWFLIPLAFFITWRFRWRRS